MSTESINSKESIISKESTEQNIPNLPLEIVRVILEMHLKSSPISIFFFTEQLFNSAGYELDERKNLIMKCLKENFELTKKPIFSYLASDEMKLAYKSENFFYILNIVKDLLKDENLELICENVFRYISFGKMKKIIELSHLQWIYDINPQCIKLSKTLCTYAVGINDLEMLKWLRYVDSEQNEHTIITAITSQNLDIVKWLRAQKQPCPWNESCCYFAAINKDLTMLKFLRSENPPCPWDKLVLSELISQKNYDMIKWCRSQNPPCPWDESTIIEASDDKDMVCYLRYLDPPCPWDENFYLSLISKRSFDIIKYVGNKCPINEECIYEALKTDTEIFHFLIKNFPYVEYSKKECRKIMTDSINERLEVLTFLE
jgi:hypothetical protein